MLLAGWVFDHYVFYVGVRIIVMFDFLMVSLWSPYLVGFGIGLLVVISLVFSDNLLGASTAFARTAGMFEGFFNSDVGSKEYYSEVIPKVDWEWMLVLGVVVGAFVSSMLSGDFRVEVLPSLWVSAFGESLVLRLLGAVVGGMFIGFGARMGGGCTSGHGISGTLQLTIGSWLAFLSFFVGGIITALFLFQFLGGL